MASYATSRRKSKEDKAKKPVDAVLRQLLDWADMTNVADDLDEGQLHTIGGRVVSEFKIDEASRSEWKDKAEKSLERAKLKTSKKSYPFDGAANVKYPLLTTAALQFAARAYPAIVEGQRIVKGQVIGDDPDGGKRAKCERISKHMSYQLTNEMPEWEEDTDILLHQIPVIGCAFRKVFYDPTLKRNRSEMVSAIDLIINQKTRSLETVPRITQTFTLYPHEVEERIADGAFVDCDLGTASSGDSDEDAPHEFLEQHRWLDLNDDGQREPWIITVHKDTEKVVRIVANYDPAQLRIEADEDGKNQRLGRIPRYNVFVKYPFFRDPGGGFYDLGFGELLESLSEVIDSSINQMLDAGHLQNAGGGFIGSGLRLKKNQFRFAPGQYHVVDSPGTKVREAIYNMEHPGPSPVLFQLLGMMVEAGREIANIKDILTGETAKSATATTTLALIEQGMKVYTSIYKRIYRSLKREYQLLFNLNSRHLEDEQYFIVMDDRKAVKRSDYEIGAMDIVPVADPSVVTDMQKMARAEIYNQLALNPAFTAAGGDVRECLTRYLSAIGAEEIEKILPPPPPEPPPAVLMQAEGAAAQVETQKATAAKTGAEAEKAAADAEIAKDNVVQIKKKRAKEDAKKFGDDLDSQLQALMGMGGAEVQEPAAQQTPIQPEGMM